MELLFRAPKDGKGQCDGFNATAGARYRIARVCSVARVSGRVALRIRSLAGGAARCSHEGGAGWRCALATRRVAVSRTGPRCAFLATSAVPALRE